MLSGVQLLNFAVVYAVWGPYELGKKQSAIIPELYNGWISSIFSS
jgi:hypothetical protein